MISGAMGFNGHFANVVAALYLATGQDMAHVVEGSLGMTTAEMDGDDLYFSVMLPNVLVGTLGGGTHLPVQKAALSMMGLGDGKRGEKITLGKILGATVLAGELSLTAALAAGDLARAHARLARRSQ
jgi:hydroxymethylglutaryl-CoA reductase (NADPH)